MQFLDSLLLFSVIEVVGRTAISLGVGSSTFALIFYFMTKRDPALRETGRPYQKAVYIVLRLSMLLILLTEVVKALLYMRGGIGLEALLGAHILVFMWTVVAVLFLNAILMTLHLMPMKLGPAIQATSWYTLGVLVALPVITFTYIPLVLTYLGCIIAVAVIIEMITQRLTPETPAAPNTLQT